MNIKNIPVGWKRVELGDTIQEGDKFLINETDFQTSQLSYWSNCCSSLGTSYEKRDTTGKGLSALDYTVIRKCTEENDIPTAVESLRKALANNGYTGIEIHIKANVVKTEKVEIKF